MQQASFDTYAKAVQACFQAYTHALSSEARSHPGEEAASMQQQEQRTHDTSVSTVKAHGMTDMQQNSLPRQQTNTKSHVQEAPTFHARGSEMQDAVKRTPTTPMKMEASEMQAMKGHVRAVQRSAGMSPRARGEDHEDNESLSAEDQGNFINLVSQQRIPDGKSAKSGGANKPDQVTGTPHMQIRMPTDLYETPRDSAFVMYDEDMGLVQEEEQYSSQAHRGYSDELFVPVDQFDHRVDSDPGQVPHVFGIPLNLGRQGQSNMGPRREIKHALEADDISRAFGGSVAAMLKSKEKKNPVRVGLSEPD
jgi:hypothetical protein